MKILLIDNYDSFTYNIAHIVKDLGYKLTVLRNDKYEMSDLEKYDKIILSPGPGIPKEAGNLIATIKAFAGIKPIFGVCLGLQAIVENFGGDLINLEEVFHGVSTPVSIQNQHYIFNDVPTTFEAGRYHSWAANEKTLPNEIEILAKSNDGEIMAIAHKEYDISAVQFHPESILTKVGTTIIQNFLSKQL